MTQPAPAQLSRADFLSTVLGLKPRIAVFDCDGTLWSGDAGSAFMRWTMETGLVGEDEAKDLSDRYDAYKNGSVSELAICGEMVTCFAGLPDAEMRQAASTFFRDHVEPNIFAEMRELIASLQQAGTDIWAVSSTCDWVIEEGMKRFNIASDRVLAARVAIEDGTVTKRLIDVPTDEGKVASLRAAGVTAPDAVFGNSVHDAAMLAIARRAFPVNPTPALIERSTREGWAVYIPDAMRS